MTCSFTAFEKLRVTYLALRLEIIRHLLGAVTALRFLQLIPPLVVLERRFEILLVFIGFAECETQVHAVHM